MNYGGHYRNTPENLARQARAEDLDVVYNLIVNKEERVPDIGYFRPDPDPASGDGVLILHAQEYHTSFWGHLGLLHLSDHLLTPDFSAYQHTALASPYPHNGVDCRPGARAGRVGRLCASVRLGHRSGEGEVAEQPASRRRREWQGGLYRGRRFRRPQGDRQCLVPPAQPRLPPPRRRRHRRDGQLCLAARAGRHEPGVPRHWRRNDPGGDEGRAQGRPDLRQQRPAARARTGWQAARRYCFARRTRQTRLSNCAAFARRGRSSGARSKWQGREGLRSHGRSPQT